MNSLIKKKVEQLPNKKKEQLPCKNVTQGAIQTIPTVTKRELNIELENANFEWLFNALYDLHITRILLNSLSLSGWHAIEYQNICDFYIKCKYKPKEQYKFEAKIYV
jgi:hypothetical protein